MTDWAAQFPTEFAKLTAPQARAVQRTLSSHRLENQKPDREFVANLVALTTNKIDRDEYRRRARSWSSKRAQPARAAG